ncbi:MAG: AEC family transporter [Wenzhouxiangellaceae bacterium]
MGAYFLIFGMIGLGRLLAECRWLPEQTADVLNRVVITLCLPAVIFLHVPKLEASMELLPLVLAPWLLLAVSVAIVLPVARRLAWSRPVTAVLLVMIPLGNTSFLGFPLIQALVGQDAVRYAVVYDQFGSFLIVCTHVLFVLAWYGEGASPGPGRMIVPIIGRMLRFPPMLALIGALWLGNAWFPQWLTAIAEALATMLLPLVTVAVGLKLRLRLVESYRLPLVFGLTAKLVVLPLIALLLVSVTGLQGPVRDVIVLESAMPPMITAAALLADARLAAPLATAMVAWGVLCSALTILLWDRLLALTSML